MKHKIQKVELFIGVIIFLGGLLTYGLGVHQLLPVPRPDLVVYGTTLIGIILIFMGCDIFSKPTKEMQILENDERNIAITNASLANAYKVTLTLLVLVLFALVFFNGESDFSLTGGGKKRIVVLSVQKQRSYFNFHVSMHIKFKIYGGQFGRVHCKAQFLPALDGKRC